MSAAKFVVSLGAAAVDAAVASAAGSVAALLAAAVVVVVVTTAAKIGSAVAKLAGDSVVAATAVVIDFVAVE